MRAFLDFFDRHLADVISIVSLVGAGTLLSMWAEMRGFLLQRPAAALLVAVGAYAAGFATARAMELRTEWRDRQEKRRRLADSFLCMSRRRKEIVSRALDEGSVNLSSLDPDALALCELGILGMPPIGSRLSGVEYSIQPTVAREIVNHRAEWLDR